jgi:hypothetical protein
VKCWLSERRGGDHEPKIPVSLVERVLYFA